MFARSDSSPCFGQTFTITTVAKYINNNNNNNNNHHHHHHKANVKLKTNLVQSLLLLFCFVLGRFWGVYYFVAVLLGAKQQY